MRINELTAKNTHLKQYLVHTELKVNIVSVCCCCVKDKGIKWHNKVLLVEESEDHSSCGSWFLVRTQKESKVLAIARKFINNKERKNRLQRAGHDKATEHTKKEQKQHLKREAGHTKGGK